MVTCLGCDIVEIIIQLILRLGELWFSARLGVEVNFSGCEINTRLSKWIELLVKFEKL